MTPPRLRAANEDDLEGLVALARRAGAGVTSLPPEPAHIAERLRRSSAAFAHAPAHPGGEEYLFVVEDEHEVVATSAVVARVGGFDPFYTYEIRAERVTHAPLGVDRTIDVLHLKRDHKGPSELCGLVVDPDRRGRGLGRLASLGRLMYVAAHPGRFAERTVAEIRGFQDAEGRSPFWEAVGRVFLSPRAFADADMLTGLGEKDFIADLMPSHPIYLDLLSPAVREVIGRPHRDAEGALHLLREQGFVPAREVDIFDAGPIVECPTTEIRIVRTARRARLGAIRPPRVGEPCLVAVAGPPFRALYADVELVDGSVAIDPEAAQALDARPGAELLVAWPQPA